MRAKKGAGLYARLVSLLLCAAIAATLVPHVPFTLGAESNPDADGVYHIRNFADFMGAVGHSRSSSGNTIKYVLENDIEFTPDNVAAMKGWEIDHLTFGSRDYFFLGEFDGKGHTISGLNYANNLFKVATRTGLFSFVGHKDPNEAPKYNTYIHDLTIKGANMHADYCSGILVGEAYNTRFENISIVDSAISVNPADNAVLLITDGGVYGGAVAGYAEGCTFYNCESKNTIVRTNSVSGVAAVAGKPLYLGGLVGDLESSELEYCRVMGGAVKNRYESSVGAVGGFTSYAGGLVGQAGGMTHRPGTSDKVEPGGEPCKIIDCFATCDVSFHVATYVGVAAGCAGHAGGLAGKIDDSGKKDASGKKTGATIKRCHYAGGKISSYQYNTLLLMIPIQIAHDVNRSGLVDIYEPKNIQVYDSYFNYLDGFGPESGKAAYVLGNNKITDHYGPKPDERYMDRTFWENRGFDFAGNLDRSGEEGTKGPKRESGGYYNKWVMYYYDDPVLDAAGNPTGATVRRAYPVHGLSVAATFDFPGAGEVTLKPAPETDSLSLKDGVSTRDPYRFAVLGIYPTECTPVTYTNGTVKGGVNLSIAMEQGYRLDKWYLLENVAAAGLPTGQHGYFDSIFAHGTPQESLAESNSHVAVEDNHLFVARCEAQVVFHDLKGNVLNTSGTADPNLEDDYYLYAAPLPHVTPQQNAPTKEGVRFIGWTTRKYTDQYPGSADADPGWESVTVDDLKNLREKGHFYLPGDPILKTMQLYPVYADRLLNVQTQIEGHDVPAEGKPDKTLRQGVGQTRVELLEDGKIALRVKTLAGDDPAKHTDTDPFPDGYRFLGWYENDLCVSRDRSYTLPDTVDLNAPHIYEARFEYRVQYYAIAGEYDGNEPNQPYNKPYVTRWQLYGSAFDRNVQMPVDYGHIFSNWYAGKPTGVVDKDCPVTDPVPDDQVITAPFDVHDHLTGSGGYDLFVVTDFPNSSTLTQWGNGAGINDNSVHVQAVPKEHYDFLFWLANAASGDWHAYSTNNPWSIRDGHTFSSTVTNHGAVAHMTADVIFHAKDETEKATVRRRYKEKVFLDADTAHSYKYPLQDLALTAEEIAAGSLPNPPSQAFPFTTDMTVDGYYFVGWIDKDDPDTKAALGAIYNVPGDLNTTTNVDLAKNYILTDQDIVTRAMPNIYPVYAKYDIHTATNVMLDVDGVNKPADPTYSLENDTAEITTVTVTAYNNIAVKTAEPDGEKYTIERVTVSIDGGEPETITEHTTDSSRNWVITYPVVPGKHYLFTAVYKPYVVVFHLNGQEDSATDVNEVEVEVRDYGRPIGISYLPTVQNAKNDAKDPLYPELGHALFVGWTEKKPDDPETPADESETRPYHYFQADAAGTADGKTSYQKAREFGFWTLAQTEDTVVTRSMELWPVFADYTVTVNSNIDQDLIRKKPADSGLTDEDYLNDVRTLERAGANPMSTTVRAKEVADYKFVGWYTGVELDATTGEYSDFKNATAVSEAAEYTLEGSAPFNGKTYTARYKKVYKVIYHNRGKFLSDPNIEKVIYTNYLYEGEDEDKALNTLLKDVPVKRPVLDENGNPTYDENGEIIEETVYVDYHQPLDATPYHMIYATMDSNESFGQWECHDPLVDGINPKDELVNVYPYSFDPLLPQPDGDPTDVKSKGLIARVGLNERTINLYPTVWRVTVTDSTGKDISKELDIDIDMSGMDPKSTEYKNVKVYVHFDPAKPYTQNKLTVQVQRTRWRETADPNDSTKAGEPEIALRGRNEVEVIPYLDATRKHPMAAGQMTHNLGDPKDEQKDGFAEFTFTNSLLRIEKNAEVEAKGETFLFRVTDTADSTKTWQVPVKCDADVFVTGEDGTKTVTGCTGSEVLSLPVGTYSVTEVADWAWRQEPVYAVYVNGQLQETETNDAHMKVSLQPLWDGTTPEPEAPGTRAAGTEAAKVVCTNSRIGGSDWLVKTILKQNLFGELLTSGGA